MTTSKKTIFRFNGSVAHIRLRYVEYCGVVFFLAQGLRRGFGVAWLFAFSARAALSHHRNEDGYVQLVRRLAKSVTEKKNRREGLRGEAKKTGSVWHNTF